MEDCFKFLWPFQNVRTLTFTFSEIWRFIFQSHELVAVWPEPIWKRIKKVSSSTTIIPKSLRVCINWNSSLHRNFKNYFLLSKSCFTEFTFRGTFTKKILVWKREFQLKQILGLLGIYFDAVVVECPVRDIKNRILQTSNSRI